MKADLLLLTIITIIVLVTAMLLGAIMQTIQVVMGKEIDLMYYPFIFCVGLVAYIFTGLAMIGFNLFLKVID